MIGKRVLSGGVLPGVMLLGVTAAPAGASETATYRYDAKGRLYRVIVADGPSNGVSVTYNLDDVANRTSVQVFGSSQASAVADGGEPAGISEAATEAAAGE